MATAKKQSQKKSKSSPNASPAKSLLEEIMNTPSSLPFSALSFNTQLKKLHKKLEGLEHQRVDQLLEELQALVKFNREKLLRKAERDLRQTQKLLHHY